MVQRHDYFSCIKYQNHIIITSVNCPLAVFTNSMHPNHKVSLLIAFHPGLWYRVCFLFCFFGRHQNHKASVLRDSFFSFSAAFQHLWYGNVTPFLSSQKHRASRWPAPCCTAAVIKTASPLRSCSQVLTLCQKGLRVGRGENWRRGLKTPGIRSTFHTGTVCWGCQCCAGEARRSGGLKQRGERQVSHGFCF